VTHPSDEEIRAVEQHFVDAVFALLKRLREIRPDPSLRWQLVEILGALGNHLGHIRAPANVVELVHHLAMAICDLEDGRVDPLLAPVTPKQKGFATDTWHLRMWIALGLECLLHSGLTRDEAIVASVAGWPETKRMLGASDRAIWDWHDRLIGAQADVESVEEPVRAMLDKLGIGTVSAAQHEKLAGVCFSRARLLVPAKT